MAKKKDPVLEFHVVSKHNKVMYPNSPDPVFKVKRSTHRGGLLNLARYSYELSGSEHDPDWTASARKSPFLTYEDDGNGFVISKRMDVKGTKKTYRLEYDEAEELLLALMLNHLDRESCNFEFYKKKSRGNRR